MTKSKIIILAVLVLALGAVIVFGQKKNIPTAPPDNSIVTTAKSQCYGRTQTATTDAPYSVEEYVVLNFDGVHVTGTKKGTQAGPDMTNGYEGTLEGFMNEFATEKEYIQQLELTYDYTVEGSHNRELEVYTFRCLPESQSEAGCDLVKNRWALTESKINGRSILVPDYKGDPTLITYEKETCQS
jgi:hypothetical protein